MKRILTLIALLFSLHAQAIFIQGTGTTPSGKTNTFNINFWLKQAVVNPGHVTYQVNTRVVATNGFFAPIWLDPGLYTAYVGPFSNAFPVLVQSGTNTYDWTALIQTNAPNFPTPAYLQLIGGAMQGSISWAASATNSALALPSLTTSQRTGLSPTNGDLVFDSTLGQYFGYDNAWQQLGSSSGSSVYFDPIYFSTNAGIVTLNTNFVTSYNYATVTQLSAATNGAVSYIVTLGYVTANITNGLISTANAQTLTNIVFLASSNLVLTASNALVTYFQSQGFVTASVTNGLASQGFVTSQGYDTIALRTAATNAVVAWINSQGYLTTAATPTFSSQFNSSGGVTNIASLSASLLTGSGTLPIGVLPAAVVINGQPSVGFTNAGTNVLSVSAIGGVVAGGSITGMSGASTTRMAIIGGAFVGSDAMVAYHGVTGGALNFTTSQPLSAFLTNGGSGNGSGLTNLQATNVVGPIGSTNLPVAAWTNILEWSNSFASLNGWKAVGGQTVFSTTASNTLLVLGTNTDYGTYLIYTNWTTAAEYWTATFGLRINSPAGGCAVGFGIVPLSDVNDQENAIFSLYDAGGAPQTIYSYYYNMVTGTLGNQKSGGNFSAVLNGNDYLNVTVSRHQYTMAILVSNTVSGKVLSLNYAPDPSQATNGYWPTVGNFAIWSLGLGVMTNIIYPISFNIGAPPTPDVVFVGDSMLSGFGATNRDQTSVELTRRYTGMTCAIEGGVGATTWDMTNLVPEINLLNAKRAIILGSANDVGLGSNSTTILANLGWVYSNINPPLKWLCDGTPLTGLGTSTLPVAQLIESNYVGHSIDTWQLLVGGAGTTSYGQQWTWDGVHWSPMGHQKVADLFTYTLLGR